MATSRKGIKWRKPKTGKIISCLICGKEKYYHLVSIQKGGGKYCSYKCAGISRKGVRGNIFSKEHKEKISLNHHNVSGKNNPNWKGGITNEQTKLRNKFWKERSAWRESVQERDQRQCKNCKSTSNLHAHHIIAFKTLPSAQFIRANGITLCETCHRKTDSWGGGKDIVQYNKRGNIVGFFIKVIPHSWQDYNTAGNYFLTDDAWIVIFCSDTGNNKYNLLIMAHEMFESAMVIEKKIPIKEIDKFDMKFEDDREKGLHTPEAEPGDDPQAPYHREHVLATAMERQMAQILGVDWETYDKACLNL